MIFFRLELISKEVGKSNCLQILHKSMQAQTFSQHFGRQPLSLPHISHKRSLPLPEDSDPEDLQPTKRTLFKSNQNSIGFSDTVNTCSKLSDSPNSKTEEQHLRPEDRKKDPNFTVQLVKSQLLFNSGSNIRNWKRLLPKELTTNLPAAFQNLLKVAALIDQILMRKSSYDHMDAFDNIRSELQTGYYIDLSLILLRQINFISDKFYCFYQDPLKNLVIGLPSSARQLSSRKKNLRVSCYQFSQRAGVEMGDDYNEDLRIPERQLLIDKIQRFFPIKVKKDQKRKQASLLKEEFVQRIGDEISRKDNELMKECQNFKAVVWSKTELYQFAEQIIQLYNHHKVKNMFRANLVQWFREQGRSIDMILSGIEVFQNLGVFLYSHPSIGKAKIYQLKGGQKQLALCLLTDNQAASG